MKIIYLLLISLNVLADVQIKPIARPKQYLHYGVMSLTGYKTQGETFLQTIPTNIRAAQYLHEVYKKQHIWNWDGDCRMVSKVLTCKALLIFSESEYMRFKWVLKPSNILTETVTYYINQDKIRATWKGRVKRTLNSEGFVWDLTHLGF